MFMQKWREEKVTVCFAFYPVWTLGQIMGRGTVENHVRQEITKDFTAGDTKCEV